MRGTNQGGSLAGFIIVGVLLALVLIGGVYGLNRYNAERAKQETAQEEEAPATEDRQRTDSGKEESASKTDPIAQTSPKDPGDKSTTGTTPAPVAAQLPQTGPADTLMALLAVTALAFAATHYVRSRHA